jgi:hypothetical protein
MPRIDPANLFDRNAGFQNVEGPVIVNGVVQDGVGVPGPLDYSGESVVTAEVDTTKSRAEHMLPEESLDIFEAEQLSSLAHFERYDGALRASDIFKAEKIDIYDQLRHNERAQNPDRKLAERLDKALERADAKMKKSQEKYDNDTKILTPSLFQRCVEFVNTNTLAIRSANFSADLPKGKTARDMIEPLQAERTKIQKRQNGIIAAPMPPDDVAGLIHRGIDWLKEKASLDVVLQNASRMNYNPGFSRQQFRPRGFDMSAVTDTSLMLLMFGDEIKERLTALAVAKIKNPMTVDQRIAALADCDAELLLLDRTWEFWARACIATNVNCPRNASASALAILDIEYMD